MAHKAVNLRLDADLLGYLDGIVEADKRKIEEAGVEAEANYSTALRRLIKQEARKLGLMDAPATTPKPKGKR